VGAMVQKTASFHTTYEIVEEKTEWMKPSSLPGFRVENSIEVHHGGHRGGMVFASGHGQPAAESSPLTLQQAVNIALERNPLRKAALADTRVAFRRCSRKRDLCLCLG